MFFKKKKQNAESSPRQEAITFIQKAQEFERSQLDAVRRNNRVAWRVAGVSMFISVLAVGAVIGLTPLKSVQPFVLRVDNNTGATDVVTSIRDIKKLKYDEAIDKFWLGQYIRFREGYGDRSPEKHHQHTAYRLRESGHPGQRHGGAGR